MTNWKSTLGGALAALGTFLFGGPLALTVAGVQMPQKLLVALVVIGFLCQGLGIFFGHLWSADAKNLSLVARRVDENSAAIRTGDTRLMGRIDVGKPADPAKPLSEQ